jgi:hypothetical protein
MSNDLYVDGTAIGGVALATNGNNLYFNYDDGVAADANIIVRRGVDPDAYFKWDEATDTWIASNNLKSEGNLTADGSIFTNGDLTLNNDVGASNAVINFRNPSGDQSILFNNANQQFEISAQTYITGNHDLYVSGDKIQVNAANAAADSYVYFNNTEYLGWDNANQRFNFTDDLDVNGSVTCSDVIIDGASTINTQTTTTTTTTATNISSTSRTTQKVLITITDNVTGYMHVLEAMAFQHSGNAYLTTYAEMYTNTALATFTADVSGGLIRILATPASTNSTTFTVTRISVD